MNDGATRDRAVRDGLLDGLLDVHTILDPRSVLEQTLKDALELDQRRAAVAWVALPSGSVDLTIAHVIGQRTSALQHLDVGTGQGLTGRVHADPTTHWVEDYTDDASITHEFDRVIEAEGLRRMVAAPMSVDGRVLGVLTVGHRDIGPIADRMVAHVDLMAQRAGLALTVAQETRERVEAAALAERRRISEEIHDSVSALLFSIGARTERMQRRSVDQEVARELSTLREEVVEVGGIVRELITGWHASASADLRAEIEGQVEGFRRRTGLDAVAVFLGPPADLDAGRVEALSRFVAVALANAERHAQATRVTVTVASAPDHVAAVVSNDGPTLRERIRPGIGLSGTSSRIAGVGGDVAIVTDGTDEGFTIRARVPR
nr:GAF domain-containing protein [uncultured Nocardioides sp.]